MSLRDKFVADCRLWYRQWSVWFAMLAGFILQELAANPQAALDLAAMIEPEWLRRVVVFGVASGVPILLRMVKQPGLERARAREAEGGE